MPYPDQYTEDTSYLPTSGEHVQTVRYIYEPLVDLVKDDWLRPYCWGCNQVAFYPWWDSRMEHKVRESSHAWRHGQLVESGGQWWELLSAKVVHRCEQWCVQWLGRRAG